MIASSSRAAAVLEFWFGAPDDPQRLAFRDRWFERTDAFDAEIRGRFQADIERAAAGADDGWAETAAGALALVILLDKFPRNAFRGTPRAFATDAPARRIAAAALAAGHDRGLAPVERMFLYMPFVHSEALADQDRAVALMAAIPVGAQWDATLRAESLASAERHREIIARFGRFPHRNAALGRTTTPEEEAFLREPNSSF